MTATAACAAVSPSSSVRILRSMSAAATRKWPEPQQGSMTVTSAARLGPALERAGGRGAVVAEAQVLPLAQERAVRVAARPPGAERVLEQEADHVVLGEELGHRRQVGPADLVAPLVDLVLALALPELVDPAEGVVRGEQLGRQALEDGLEAAAVLGGEGDPVGGVVGPEDAGQHRRGIAGGEDPGVALALLGGQLPDVGERDRRALGVEQQAVLGEEPGEQHPVPLLVGDLLDQERRSRGRERRRPGPWRARAGPSAGRAAPPRGRPGLRVLDAEARQGSPGRRLGEAARAETTGAVQVAPELGGEGRHRSDDHRVAGVEVPGDRARAARRGRRRARPCRG